MCKGSDKMKFTVIIDPDCDEEITLRLRERGELEEKIKALLRSAERAIVGYGEGEILPLDLSSVGCFFVEGGRTYATVSGIVNVREIERFDASIAGSLIVVMKDGTRECISRRQLRAVKERIGFKL